MPITYRVHPAIGIACVGDSPDDFYIGPEAPGVSPVLTPGVLVAWGEDELYQNYFIFNPYGPG